MNSARFQQILVQSGTAIVIGCTGDAIVQHMEASWREEALAKAAPEASPGDEAAAAPAVAHANEHDWGRSARMAAFRAPQAPILAHVWGRFDTWALRLGLSGPLAVAFKVSCDQALLNPTVTTCFFASQGAMEGVPWGEVADRVRLGFWPTVTAAFQYWVFAHAITFSVVPVPFRIAWTSSAAVVWTAYLSHTNQGLKEAHAEAEAAEDASGGDCEVESAVASAALGSVTFSAPHTQALLGEPPQLEKKTKK